MTTHHEDIQDEKITRKKWNLRNTKPEKYAEGILITGPNSFIGAHIIKEIQDHSDIPVHLLLRAPNREVSVMKMKETFDKWKLGNFDFERFIIHTGDITLPQMGLKQNDFTKLKRETGTVVHLAMTPLYHLPYQHFQRVWLPELERMIHFCGDPGTPKILHYASSFNANFFLQQQDFEALNSNAWQSGYAGFKWVANKALQNAFDQNLKGCIYDIPLVLGSEEHGICPTHYSIWMILDMFLKTGLFFPFQFRIIPVDVLAKIFAMNIPEHKKGGGESLLRPVLEKPVTDKLFSSLVAGMLGLKEGGLNDVKGACQNKLRAEFMVPDNFYELLDKVNGLPAIFPDEFKRSGLPETAMVFMSNLNRVLAKNEELSVES